MNNNIKFDNVTYKIEFKDKRNENNMGRIFYKTATIEIDETMNDEVKNQVLFHECTHLILANLGESELNDNEGFVERLSNAFYRLVKDNKETLKI